jgi:hypothetical protein
MALVFLATALQSAGLFLLLNSLASYAWMRAEPLIFSFLRGAGLLMIGLGGAWCLAERRGPRIVAYALLADFGVSLLAAARLRKQATDRVGMAGARRSERRVGPRFLEPPPRRHRTPIYRTRATRFAQWLRRPPWWRSVWQGCR